jgi:hypothetical protein
MKRTLLLGTLCAALLAPVVAAQAHANVSVAVSTPQFGIRIGAPVYAPVPVYAPAPVYAPVPVYAPMPVYAPRPVVVPRVIYPAPVVVPRVIFPRPVYVAPPRYPGVRVAPWRYDNRHWSNRHDRHDPHRHGGQRAGYGF